MKVLLSVTNHELNGYKLISPLKGENPIKVNEYIDDGEASEIIADQIIQYVAVEQMMNFVAMLSQKLKRGGQLTITSTDLTILSEKYIRGELNVVDYNKILFGSKTHAWDFKLSCITLGDVVDIANRLNLKILEKRINDYNFVIKVERQ